MPEKIPIRLEPNSDIENRMKRFLQDKVRSIRIGSEGIHKKVVKWRKNYEGIPSEEIREFPFHNASNLVVPIIAIHSDTLLARVISAILKTQPPWIVRAVAGATGIGEGLSDSLERFLGYIAYEPTELDLCRVYHEWLGEAIRYGTSVIKSPWIQDVEDFVVSGDGSGGDLEYSVRTLYEGPRPEKLGFDDFGIPPNSKTVESANFKYHIIRLQREDLEHRKFTRVYEPAAVSNILGQPDRTSPRFIQQQLESDSGAKTVSGYGFAEWDIYECWFRYRIDSKHYVKCIFWYHEKTNTILRAFYSYYPEDPFIAARLFYRDDAFHGYGFAEMLEPIADELSKMHNGRLDNQTITNTKVWRVNPDSVLHQGYHIFPSAMLPAEKDEIEPLEHGESSQVNIDSERLSLDLAEKRTGVSAPIQGTGSGFNTKRGIYTAMGTLSILQEGNTRTDLNITDLRYAHTKLGRMVAAQFAAFGGIGEGRKLAFGEMTEKIEQALSAVRDRRIALPISASTSSINREVEKQNDIMLTSLLDRHYQMETQMLQAAANPIIPENIRNYIYSALEAKEYLMKQVLRHFTMDEVDKMVPTAQKAPSGGNQTPPQGGMPQMPAGIQ